MTVYNEFDPGAAAWLTELISQGCIQEGIVDGRDIREIEGADLDGGGTVHLFAGIGGWAHALDLAGWPRDRPVWTGSCPCQPYSAAGKGKGDADERNLWPEMFRLILECRPDTVFGEQVEGAVGHGWLDRVCADLEGEGYAVGSCVLGAHSAGSPHIRQRIYWVANSVSEGLEEWQEQSARGKFQAAQRGGDAGGLAEPDGGESGDGGVQRGGEHGLKSQDGDPGFWDRYDLIPCRDGKARRVEPGSFPLAHGIPGRVGLLRGYGNAIVPEVAAEFIRAYCGE